MTQPHTPAPWDVGNQPSNAIAWRVVASDDRDVAHVFGSGAQSKANAHLIAAAPDLLEALKSLQAIMCDPENNPSFAGSDGDRTVAREAFAAIAKAEGRT